MPTDTDALVAPGEIKLAIEQDPDGQVHSSVPVSWCLSPDIVERLKERGVENPYALIVVTNGGMEVSRDVVPLTSMMTYVQFRRPGKNRIHAAVVWSTDENPKKVLIKKDDHGDYRCKVVDQRDPMLDSYRDASGLLSWERVVDDLGRTQRELAEESDARKEPLIAYSFTSMQRLPEEGVLEVEVPKEMFAKAPPEILQRFVGILRERKPHDQCHFRRRLLLSFPLVPLALVVLMALMVVAEIVSLLGVAVLLIAGKRGINYDPVRRPHEHPPWEVWEHIGRHTSVWYTKKDDSSTFFLLWFINPATLSVLGITAGVLALFGVLDEVTAFTVGQIGPIALVIAALATAGLALRWLVLELFGARIEQWKERREQEREVAEQNAQEAYLRGLELLACGEIPQPTSYRDLPREHRTVRLRYLNVKSKICKPFAS